MLAEPDVLVLKLALERGLVDAPAYDRVLEALHLAGSQPRAAALLRGVGVSGKEVGILVELATPVGTDAQGAILARCDVENTLTERALANAGAVTPQILEGGRALVREHARKGFFYDTAELLAEKRLLNLLQAADLRRRARELVATCPSCFRHYLMRKERQGRCARCGGALLAGRGQSAIDAWRPVAETVTQSGRFRLGGADGTPGTDRFPALGQLEAAQAPAAAGAASPAPAGAAAAAPLAPGAEPTPATADLPELRPGLPPGAPLADGVAADAGGGSAIMMADSASSEAAGTTLGVEQAVGRFGSYEVLSELARGGVGVVYKARRGAYGETVALKVLIAGPKATPKTIARFEREARVARAFDHPNVVKVLDAGVYQGYRFLAMQFAPGTTLEELASERPLEPARAARVLVGLARAVEYIHGEGVIHRDLKPENIIVDADDVPTLIDFGLVKTGESEKLTQTATTIGTPSFMSPEQAQGQSGAVGRTTDVYGLGAILYAVLVGEPAFTAENFMDLFRKIVNEPPPTPSSRRRGIPAALDAVVLKAMAKAPAARYPTAAAFREDLERFLAGEPVEAAPAAASDHRALSSSDADEDAAQDLDDGRDRGRGLKLLAALLFLAAAAGALALLLQG